MNQKMLIPSLIVIIVLGSTHLYFRAPIETSPSDIIENVKEYFQNLGNSQELDPAEAADFPEESDVQTTGGSIGGGGAGGGGGGGSNSQIICTLQPSPFALRKPTTQETCNTLQGQDCVDKTVDCELEVHNLQSQDAGVFEIKISIVNEVFEEVYSTSESQTIEPGSFQTYVTQSSFQDPAIAEQKLTCFFNAISVPNYEVCA